MKTNDKLQNVSIESLDAFEETMYYEYSKKMSKVDALQRIIDDAEGDYTRLSDELADIAQDQ
jgi:hypothetical protein